MLWELPALGPPLGTVCELISESKEFGGASEPAAPLELGTNGGHLGSVICLSSHVSVLQSQPHTVFPAGRGVLAGVFTGLCSGKSPWVRTTQLPAQTWSAAAFCPADSVAQIFLRTCPPSCCAPFSHTGQATAHFVPLSPHFQNRTPNRRNWRLYQ